MSLVQMIRGFASAAAGLDRQVHEALAPRSTEVKRPPMFTSVPFEFLAGEYGAQKQPWVNGGEDAFITEVGYDVMSLGPTALTPMDYVVLGSLGAFDFEWNYVLTSSGASYVSQANGVGFADRRSLGNPLRGRYLQFKDPLVVPAGDSLVWTARPTLWGLYSSSPAVVALNIYMAGYRTGTIAEADYVR